MPTDPAVAYYEARPPGTHCQKCFHLWRHHETVSYPTNDLPPTECGINMGMGDWCGCKEKRPEDWDPVEDFVKHFEATASLLLRNDNGRIVGYQIERDQWNRLTARLREEVHRGK